MRFFALFFFFLSFFHLVHADEIWLASNFKGYAAYSTNNFKFEKDTFANKKMLITLTDGTGSVTGTDSKFIKMDADTLIGIGNNGKGASLVEVYQLNRKDKKIQITITRIGSDSILLGFPDKSSCFIGDIEQISQIDSKKFNL